jgi:hypothetical protein
MSTTTVRANARTLTDRDDPSELFRKFMEDLDETQLSPAFAALHREFRAAVEGEDAAFLAFDGTDAAMARAMGGLAAYPRDRSRIRQGPCYSYGAADVGNGTS